MDRPVDLVHPMTYKTLLLLVIEKLWEVKKFTGITIYKHNDKSTWTLKFCPGTTEEEKVALRKVIEDFDEKIVRQVHQ